MLQAPQVGAHHLRAFIIAARHLFQLEKCTSHSYLQVINKQRKVQTYPETRLLDLADRFCVKFDRWLEFLIKGLFLMPDYTYSSHSQTFEALP